MKIGKSILCVALFMAWPTVEAGELSGSRPNIILFLADDCSWPEMSAVGNPILKTPNIDRLYHGGTRFTNFHVAPNCAPTRTQLMTGNHNFRSGVISTPVPYSFMSRKSITVAQCLKKVGYRTAHVGKWHMGHGAGLNAWERGFDLSITGGPGGSFRPECGTLDGVFTRNGEKFNYKGYRTDALFDEAMKWIGEVQDAEEPFFLYLATYNPHAGFDAPKKWSDPYEDKGLIDNGLVRGARNWGAGFYGEVANMDWNIGRLMEFMKTEGLEENTILMYMTDNGHAMGGSANAGISETTGFVREGGLWNMGMRGGKGLPWRGGTCVPWIFYWPGKVKADCAIDTLSGGVDFLPTMVDLAGGTVEHKIDGLSVVPLLEAPKASMSDRAMFVNTGSGATTMQSHEEARYRSCSIQTQHYRLVNGDKFGRKIDWQLFDHRIDPGEKKNIAAQHPELVSELKRKYDAWYDDVASSYYSEDVKEFIQSGGAAKRYGNRLKKDGIKRKE